jgi:hypothetical protein
MTLCPTKAPFLRELAEGSLRLQATGDKDRRYHGADSQRRRETARADREPGLVDEISQ